MPATPLAGNDRDGARSARTQPGVPDARPTAEPWMGAARRPVCRAAAACSPIAGRHAISSRHPAQARRSWVMRRTTISTGQQRIPGRERPHRPGAARAGSSAFRAAAARAIRRTSSPSRSSVAVELNRGPAMQGREAEVPVFVAVTEGETILDKRTVRMHGRVSVQCRSRHADARAKNLRAAGDRDQVGRGLHHPRRLSAHA